MNIASLYFTSFHFTAASIDFLCAVSTDKWALIGFFRHDVFEPFAMPLSMSIYLTVEFFNILNIASHFNLTSDIATHHLISHNINSATKWTNKNIFFNRWNFNYVLYEKLFTILYFRCMSERFIFFSFDDQASRMIQIMCIA